MCIAGFASVNFVHWIDEKSVNLFFPPKLNYISVSLAVMANLGLVCIAELMPVSNKLYLIHINSCCDLTRKNIISPAQIELYFRFPRKDCFGVYCVIRVNFINWIDEKCVNLFFPPKLNYISVSLAVMANLGLVCIAKLMSASNKLYLIHVNSRCDSTRKKTSFFPRQIRLYSCFPSQDCFD